MSILIFLLVLFILVLVHEWGHFIVAKKTGMRVDEFGIGFPPKLYGVKKGGTEYTLNALPIGGFVKIWGENGEEMPTVAEEVTETAAGRSFAASPKWAQALVLIAGVTMNILFAWFLFSLTYMIGVPTPVDETAATAAAQLYIAGTLPDSPAAALPAGAVVNSISFGDTVISHPTPSAFSQLVQTAAPEAIGVEYAFGGDTKTIELTPVQGLMEDNKDQYVVGVSLSMVEIQKMGFFTALSNGFSTTYIAFMDITKGLFGLIKEAFVGKADFSQVAGPVGIVGMVGDAAAFGITALLTFTAVISLNLAVINLLPFPALDGGRLVFVAIETISRKRIPVEWAGRVNLVGFAILMLLMIAVTYHDITRLL